MKLAATYSHMPRAMPQRLSVPDTAVCVACGTCMDVCPRAAITVFQGSYAVFDPGRCVGCGLCSRACPAGVIRMEVRS